MFVQVIFLMERNYMFGMILQLYKPAELVSKLRSWQVSVYASGSSKCDPRIPSQPPHIRIL